MVSIRVNEQSTPAEGWNNEIEVSMARVGQKPYNSFWKIFSAVFGKQNEHSNKLFILNLIIRSHNRIWTYPILTGIHFLSNPVHCPHVTCDFLIAWALISCYSTSPLTTYRALNFLPRSSLRCRKLYTDISLSWAKPSQVVNSHAYALNWCFLLPEDKSLNITYDSPYITIFSAYQSLTHMTLSMFSLHHSQFTLLLQNRQRTQTVLPLD